MSFNHPFGSWAESGQVFGALPYVSDPAHPNLINYYFINFNPNILNCSIVNSQSQTVYRIVTDNQMPGYTVIKNVEGKNVSLVEWQTHPMVEVRGQLSKQYVRTWLPLSSDKSSRTMTVRGMTYTWAPRERSINLYAGGSRNPMFLAKITRTNGAITLEMTPDAVQLGLLDTAVSAALLLQCGRNID
ncbi:hypothetical protein BDN70DRAFT_949149 [Pholiota conissans]|uniref:DUF6593 domain-containing protein n=1 Tax=Pholiota conissans TaxID=109636 RepID=A0A9P6CS65_9AGAR|nr:hypothetical protein BDN70DRAFT_949149 [Pholiota conissans]